MDACYRHPDRPAVERCEICGRPVCGSDLWYEEGGQRLCPIHGEEQQAKGKTVHPPETYAAGILVSEESAATPAPDRAPYRGNSNDLTALIAAVTGIAGLSFCFQFAWAIPLVAFVLGLVGWLYAKDALDPRRARLLSGLGLAGGGIWLLFVFAMIAMCSVCFVISFAFSGGGGGP